LLATTESYFRYAAVPHLDRLLLFFATAAALPLLEPRPVALRGWALAAALGALATLVKGPFGLLPLAAAGLARAVTLRDVRELYAAALATLAAAAPAAAFLLGDRFAGGGTHWRGYLLNQILASARGARTDGEGGLMPFTGVAGRFWPGLPFALGGLALGLRDLFRRRATATALLAAFSLALLSLLALPSRKVWHHALVAWPALALLGGAAAAPLLEKLLASARRARLAFASLAAMTLAAALLSALGAGARLSASRCVLPAALVARLPRGTDLLVIAPEPDWKVVAALAWEHRLAPWPAFALPPDGALETWPPGSAPQAGRRASLALVREASLPAQLGNWREEGRELGWVLLRR
jgi:hypothetical protein